MATKPLNLSINTETRRRLDELAADRGVSMSQVVEDLIDEAWGSQEHYFLKQTAFQSFLGMALSIAVARKTLGPEVMADVRQQAADAAHKLFGAPPEKRYADHTPQQNDPRIEALFRAFEGD
ncbi:CopG family transcriptional regulator [Caulobacter sp. 17J65-9]|uniref:ribbon-helix-helix domain-containing protein n=1 Tax=Caulobacter sp. 17J65-9 TaxID=2709382 RepID=UPI0013C9B431|nr:CopG family transcriptional regulator [Caulobacter sp. 17J65-9]NEX91184.1 ribbon-helix-helix protein, CopG family [Caulobacter sp. 17J65-9]